MTKEGDFYKSEKYFLFPPKSGVWGANKIFDMPTHIESYFFLKILITIQELCKLEVLIENEIFIQVNIKVLPKMDFTHYYPLPLFEVSTTPFFKQLSVFLEKQWCNL